MVKNSKSTNYPKKSAFNKMTNKIPIVYKTDKVSKAQKYILSNLKKFEIVDYIYVTENGNKLFGVISIKDLYSYPKNKTIEQVYKPKDIIAVTPKTTQKRTVYTAIKNDLISIPVLDENQVLLGVIPTKSILSIIHREAREDVLRLTGISKSHADIDDIFQIPIFQAFKHRIPWLLLGLIGGIFAAFIVNYYNKVLESNIILAAFIPLLAYMADAVGTQIEAFTIRDFALSNKLNFFKYFSKQFVIVLNLGAFISILFYAASILIYHNNYVSIVVSLALFGAILSSTLTGLIIPYIFNKFKQDPANASGPIGTILQDLLTITIYFLIASALL